MEEKRPNEILFWQLAKNLEKLQEKKTGEKGPVVTTSKSSVSFILGKGSFGIVRLVLTLEDRLYVSKRLKSYDQILRRPIDIVKELAYVYALRKYCAKCLICPYILNNDDPKPDLIVDGEYFTLNFEYEKGSYTLESYVHMNRKRLNSLDMCVIMYKCVKCLNYLHSLGLIHKDVKADNIMFIPGTFDIKYIDFGMSCGKQEWINDETIFKQYASPNFLENIETCPASMAGTPPFMAPELFSIMRSDTVVPYDDAVKQDIWSLGASMLWLMTGKYIVQGKEPARIAIQVSTITDKKVQSVIDKSINDLDGNYISGGISMLAPVLKAMMTVSVERPQMDDSPSSPSTSDFGDDYIDDEKDTRTPKERKADDIENTRREREIERIENSKIKIRPNTSTILNMISKVLIQMMEERFREPVSIKNINSFVDRYSKDRGKVLGDVKGVPVMIPEYNRSLMGDDIGTIKRALKKHTSY
jgi:serine/threonine protein kinase